MTESMISAKDGTTEMVINLITTEDGSLRRPEVFGDAVIVQMIYAGDDEDGKPTYQRFISLMVKNEDMKPILKEEVKRILRSDDETAQI